MTASTRRELRSAATSTSTTAIDLIRALTDARPIKPTSTRCLSARRPNPGRGSTYRRGNSVQTTAATSDLGEFDHRFNPEHRCRHWPSLWTKKLGTPNNPAIRFARGTVFAATLVRNCYGLPGCWPPCTDLTGLPANGGFYFQAFDGSVTLPVAGYNYNSVWTPLLAGLSPAGMAASLAALIRPCSALDGKNAGERGPQGPAGPPGKDAVKLVRWTLDRATYTATPVMSDGSWGPPLDLRALFEQFWDEVR